MPSTGESEDSNGASQCLSPETFYSGRGDRMQPNSMYRDACCGKSMNHVF